MRMQRDWLGLLVTLALLVGAVLLLAGLWASSAVEAQSDGILTDPLIWTASEPSGAGLGALSLATQPAAAISNLSISTNEQRTVSPASIELDAPRWITAGDIAVADSIQNRRVQTGPMSRGRPSSDDPGPRSAAVTGLQNDAGSVFVTPTSLTVAEPNSTNTFLITLASEPTSNVAIPLAASNDECAVSSSLITLTPGDWTIGVTATVAPIDDYVADGSQTCIVQTGPTVSGDPEYDNLDPDDVTVTVLDDDTASVSVAPTTLTVSEPDGSDTFLIALTSEPTTTVSVPLSASNAECVVSPSTVALTTTNWYLGATASVTAVDDDVADGSQTCTIQTGPTVSLDNGYNGLDPDDVTVTVEDDDEAGIVVAPTSLTVAEPDGTATFTLTLTSQPTATVSIPLSAANEQCTVSSASVNLEATTWTTGVTVTVTAVDDVFVDGPQPCRIQTGPTVSLDSNYSGLDPDDVIVTVEDDDEPGIEVSPTSLAIAEPDGFAIFTLTLTSQPTATVSIALAASNEQCTVSPTSIDLDALSWLTGVTAKVTAVDDAFDDGPQPCLVETGAAASADPTYDGMPVPDVSVTVEDDDEPGIEVAPTNLTVAEPDGTAIFTLTLTSQPTATVSIALSAANEQCTVLPASAELNGDNWAAGIAAIVTAVDDAIHDGSQSCLIQTGPTASADPTYDGMPVPDVAVTVEDNDEPGIEVTPTNLTIAEPSSTDTFHISLTSEPTKNVAIPLATSNTECSVSPDIFILTPADWATGVTITVAAVDDDVADGSQTCVVQTGPTVSSDPEYDEVDPDDVTVTVLDNETASVFVRPITLTVAEPDGSDTFRISLTSEPTSTVSVPLAASNAECIVSPGTVTLTTANWETGVTASVTAVDDDVADGSQTCTVQTGPTVSSDPEYDNLDPDDVIVTVEDDDEPGLAVAPTNLTVAEPDGTATLTLTLTSQPTATVAIALSASNEQCTVSPGSVSLDPTTWHTGMTATVTAVDDAIADGTQTCWVEAGPADSTDPTYDGLSFQDIPILVEDDDVAGLVAFPTDLTVAEPDGSDIFTVTLTSQPTALVSIPLSAANRQCTVSPSSVSLDAASWTTGVAATVTAVDDVYPDGPEICLVKIGPTTSGDPKYNAQSAEDVTVTVLDNDTTMHIFLPSIVPSWPPIPSAPILDPVDNPDGYGDYTVTWSEVSYAKLYVLEEATSSSFSDAEEIYTGAATSHAVIGRGATRYYYRVKARNTAADSEWSAPQWADVLWEAEPNDDALTQANGPLMSGLTYYGVFPDSDDLKDYFYIDLASAQVIELWLTHIPVGQDYNLVLRDSDLQAVGYSAEVGNGNEHIVTDILPAGRYYIQVYHFSSGGSTQPYQLRVVYE